MELPELVVHDRDRKMLEARKAGANYREIATIFGVSPSTAHRGVGRAIATERSRYAAEAQDAGWLQLERYDTLLRHLWPFTRPQQIEGEDGVIQVPPAYDAVDRVLKIMAAQQRLLGLDKDTIQIEVAGRNSPEIDSGESSGEQTPAEFAAATLKELYKVGAIQGSEADLIQKLLGEDIVDAEIIEDIARVPAQAELLPGAGVPPIAPTKSSAPEWVDEDEEDYAPGSWMPDFEGEVE